MLHGFLPNGVQYFIKENHFARMAAVQVWVGAGSIDERHDQHGMAHLIEHMLFKGTKRRAVGEISATVEMCGGDMNAYTTYDRTVYYLALVSDHTRLAVDLLADAIFESSFDATELAREKEVVLEEIRRGEDDPGSKLGRKAFELAFAGTEAGRPIIGTTQSVSSFTRDDLLRFHEAWYVPSNLTVVAVGDFDEREALSWITESFGREGKPMAERVAFGERRFPETPVARLVRGDFKQPRLEICWPAPALEHPDTPGLDLAAFGLGSGEASRLSLELRDKRGVVTAADASVYAPRFGGLFVVSALMPEETLLSATEGISEVVTRMSEALPITAEEIARARVNMRAERVHQEETVEGQARASGFGLTTSFRTLFDDVYRTLIDKTEAPLVTGALKRWVASRGAVVVALVPNESPLTEEALVKAFEGGVAKGLESRPAKAKKSAGKAVKSRRGMDVHVKEIARGVRCVYRHHPSAGLLTVVAASEGGLRGEGPKTAGLYNAFAGLLGVATRRRPFERVLEEVEGRGAVLDGFSGKDSFGMRLQCLTEFGEPLLELLMECLLQPKFPEARWKILKKEILEEIRAQEDSPANVAVRRFQEMLFGDHPYKYPIHGLEATVRGFSGAGLEKAFAKARDGGPWVISASGSWEPSRFFALLRKNCASWKPSSKKRVFAGQGRREQPTSSRAEIFKDREQTHIVFGYRGIDWFDKDRAVLDVLANCLGGNGGRLFMNLRDRESLAYAVAPVTAYGCHPGAIGAYIACAPQKLDQAMEGLKREMLSLAREGVTEEELKRAQNYIVGGHESEMQRSQGQATTMALMELYGIGWDDFTRYPQLIHKVKAADVKRLAARLFREEWSAVSIVGRHGEGKGATR